MGFYVQRFAVIFRERMVRGHVSAGGSYWGWDTSSSAPCCPVQHVSARRRSCDAGPAALSSPHELSLLRRHDRLTVGSPRPRSSGGLWTLPGLGSRGRSTPAMFEPRTTTSGYHVAPGPDGEPFRLHVRFAVVGRAARSRVELVESEQVTAPPGGRTDRLPVHRCRARRQAGNATNWMLANHVSELATWHFHQGPLRWACHPVRDPIPSSNQEHTWTVAFAAR